MQLRSCGLPNMSPSQVQAQTSAILRSFSPWLLQARYCHCPDSLCSGVGQQGLV